VLAELAVPFLDSRADALGWWIGDGPEPLATLTLSGPRGSLELELLGASHRAVATVDGIDVPEVVACGRAGTALPRRHEAGRGGGRYRFASTTTSYDAAGISRVAADLRRRWTRDSAALVGVFPGSPHALTVLTGRVVAAGWSWASWHVYPSSGEVVRTRSSLAAP